MHPLKYIPYLSLLAPVSAAWPYTPKLQDLPMQPLSPQDTSSRRIVIRATANSISGFYPLYDLLSISTQAGSISVHVSPHPASSEAPLEPATLDLRSNAGSVHATLSEAIVEHHVGAGNAQDAPPPYSDDDDINQSGFPEREYITSVSTQGGSISGTFPLGARTTLYAHSGSLSNVELVVMPMNISGPRQLSTIARSGSQSVRIVENGYSVGEGKKSWREGMVSKHESWSGSVNLEYPDSWEGTIDVETASGSVSITGRGVEIIRSVEGRVIAHKGNATSAKVIVRVKSGTVDLRFG